MWWSLLIAAVLAIVAINGARSIQPGSGVASIIFAILGFAFPVIYKILNEEKIPVWLWIVMVVVILIVILIRIDLFMQLANEGAKKREEQLRLEELRNKPDEIVEVSLAQLVASPQKYKYDYTYNKIIVVLTDKMVIGSNYTNTKDFLVYLSTGNGKRDFRTSPSIKVDYSALGSMEELVMLNNHEKILVTGKVNVDNYGNISIKATNLEWWNWKS